MHCVHVCCRAIVGMVLIRLRSKVDGKWVEVVDQEEVALPLPSLEGAFDLLHQAYQCATDLQSKITALEPN